MKYPRSKGKLVLCSLLLGLLAVPCLVSWRAWRQATLNRDLIAAIKKNNPPLVISLLHEGADANSRDLSQENDSLWQKIWKRLHSKPWIQPDLPSALVVAMEADAMGANPPENRIILKELVKAGANVNRHIQGNSTLLAQAVYNHDIDMATLCLTHGANPNDDGNNDDGTPLTTAILGDPDNTMVQLLLSHGADPNARDMAHRGTGGSFAGSWDFSRQTPLICAIPFFDPKRSSTSEMKLIKALIAHGADVNGTDDSGRTALMWAINNGNSETDSIVAFLLDKGASVSCRDKNGITPLHLAFLRQQCSEGRDKYVVADATFIIHLLKTAGAKN